MQRFIEDLIDTMRHAAGAGIAANRWPVGADLAIEVGEATARRYRTSRRSRHGLVDPAVDTSATIRTTPTKDVLSVPNLGRPAPPSQVRATAPNHNSGDIVDEVAGLTDGTTSTRSTTSTGWSSSTG